MTFSETPGSVDIYDLKTISLKTIFFNRNIFLNIRNSYIIRFDCVTLLVVKVDACAQLLMVLFSVENTDKHHRLQCLLANVVFIV